MIKRTLWGAVVSAAAAVPLHAQLPPTQSMEPTARAGADQTVEWQAWVGLDGRQSSTPGGGTLTYQWTQVAGSTLTLYDADKATCYFRADEGGPPPTVYEFQLEVTNQLGLDDTDEVRIVVDPVELGFTGDPSSVDVYAPPGGLTMREGQHLARRLAYDMSPDEIEGMIQYGLVPTVVLLLTGAQTPQAVMDDAIALLGNDAQNCGPYYYSNQGQAQRHLLHLFLFDRTNVLHWRLFYCFHDLFATSTDSLVAAQKHFRKIHVDTLSDHVRGTDHRVFLQALFEDEAMQEWLDIRDSKVGQANENFMRELMELFTIGLEQYTPGVDNFTEMDVQEGSRVLTGWRMQPVIDQGCPVTLARFWQPFHDPATPLLFENYPIRTVDDESDVIDACLLHPAAPRFMAKHLFEYFCGFEPAPAVVTELAAKIEANGWNLIPTIGKILYSQAMFSPQARKAKIAPPLDFCIGMMRKLQMDFGINNVRTRLNDMGHGLLQPPSVKGWPDDQTWINQAAMVDRMEFVNQVLKVATNSGNLPDLPAKLAPFMPGDPNLMDAASFVQALYTGLDIDNEELTPAVFTRLMTYMNTDHATGQPERFDSSDLVHLQGRGTGAVYHGYTLSIGIHN